jgi:cobalt-precorrin 5A hydrolase
VTRAGRLVIVALTRGGADLAARLSQALPEAQVHVAIRWQDRVPGGRTLEMPLAETLPRLFGDPSVSGLVVVLAVGATVRLLAPWLQGKDRDPAVVCVDEAGHFAVSLLSGHRGGANALTETVAQALGACPVITTASDSAGLPAVDLLGMDEGWRIDATPEALRRAAAAVVNGDPVGVYQEVGATTWRDYGDWPANVRALDDLSGSTLDSLAALLLITDRLLEAPTAPACQVVYRPPTLVAGIGCSTGASAEDIATTVELALAQGRLAPGSLALLATIDRRLDEPGVIHYARQAGYEVQGFSAEALAAVTAVPNPSPVVQAAVGTPGVCEPAALLASGADTLLVPKVKTARATAAIARLATGRRGQV